MNTLKIENLCKSYANGVQALDDVSLKIQNGMFGLLGPNGAGKSTLMRTLVTLQQPDRGTIFFNDIDVLSNPMSLRSILGYLPQEFGVYPRISAYHLLDHLAILKGVSNKLERKELIEYLLQRVNLFEQRNKSVKEFSGGMKQRIGIAQALIGNSKLIIVDEPTAGLDPGERNRFHNLLADLGKEAIVIISTHIVDDVKELCTDMAIMHLGKVLYNGSPQEALASLEGKIWQKEIERKDLSDYARNYQLISHRMHLGKQVIHAFSEQALPGFTTVPANLEDVFFNHILQSSPSA